MGGHFLSTGYRGKLCRVLGGEISTSVHFPTQPPEAYSQSLHKPSCEEMMVQGDEAG